MQPHISMCILTEPMSVSQTIAKRTQTQLYLLVIESRSIKDRLLLLNTPK